MASPEKDDEFFLQAMGMEGWYSVEVLARLFRRDPTVDDARIKRWLDSATEREVLEKDESGRGFRISRS